MEKGRRKIRICLLGMVLAAMVVGALYYYYNENGRPQSSEGTLVQGMGVKYYGC